MKHWIRKTPLLRSMEALEHTGYTYYQTLWYLTATKVVTSVGPEQEYFLVDKDTYDKRKDLIFWAVHYSVCLKVRNWMILTLVQSKKSLLI